MLEKAHDEKLSTLFDGLGLLILGTKGYPVVICNFVGQ